MNKKARRIHAMLISSLVLSTAIAYAAGDPGAGRDKARSCAGCHGLDGKGRVPLAGKTASYLEEQLRDFQSGDRANQTMNAIAKQLNDQDIEDLAAYYAAQ